MQLQKDHKALSMLGLAARAGKISSGEFSAERSIKTGRSHLVIIAGDASSNTRKKFSDSCAFYKVPFLILSDKETLGHAIGKLDRAVLSVEDENLASAVMKAAGLSEISIDQ